MNIILLSGGSGKRLWPLSNEVRSKQFIKIFKGSDGTYESMLQRIYRQIRAVDPEAEITIATSKSQASAIHNQLGEDVGISVEPTRRDTFPAIALATAYLHDIKGVPEDEAVVVCPVDPYVELSYFEHINALYHAAASGNKNLVLMGIEPTYPSEKYGYIRPVRNGEGKQEYLFTEKPDAATAEKFIAEGALWNGGVFAYKLSYVLNKSRELLGTGNYQELFRDYASLRKISFDYAVAEQEKSIEVLEYSGQWKDLGTWNTLTEAMEETVVGKGILGTDCENVQIINEMDVPVLAMGLHDVVIAASPEGILVSDKEKSSFIKPFVDGIDQQIMFAEKSWGIYKVLDVERDTLTVKIDLKPGVRMNYHSHERRKEVWTVITGTGEAVVDGQKREINPGDVIQLPVGSRHAVIAGEEGLQLIEVQLGEEISVTDKKKYPWPEEK